MGKVTSKDVAQLAGVSQTTVSFVLNKRSSASISQKRQKKCCGPPKRWAMPFPAESTKSTPSLWA